MSNLVMFEWAHYAGEQEIILHVRLHYFKCAFQVAKAFWMAIGGDEDEIEGLSSGEES